MSNTQEKYVDKANATAIINKIETKLNNRYTKNEVDDLIEGAGDANLEKATYETSPATKAHSVGDYIYYNDVVYKVTSAIAIGDTIAIGTNITADTGLDVDTQMYIDGLPGDSSEDSEGIEAIVNVYGAKNLLTYPYYETTKTEYGVTFTDNGDGSVTVSGTSTRYVIMYLRHINTTFNETTDLILSGCTGGSSSTYRIVARLLNSDDSFYMDINNTDGDSVFQIPSGKKLGNIFIEIFKEDVSFETPITFYPMIRDARIIDDTWVPYAMTNKQLSDEVNSLNSNMTKNNFDTQVDLTAYSDINHLYTATSDGYVRVGATETGLTGYTSVTIYSNSYGIIGNVVISINNPGYKWAANSIFVKKGMKMCCPVVAEGQIAVFLPLK